MALKANTIEQVIDIMDGIVDDAMAHNRRLGFFTTMYRTTTIVVKERCDEGNFFEDNDRMRELDAIFANRYFDAYDAYMNGGKPTEAWGVSFEQAQNPRLIILQHLLMGMNAHISLDLGVSTAEIAKGDLTPSLERDFMRLNNLLAGLIDTVQDEIGIVSPFLKYMDWFGGRFDESFVSYSINYARDRAWSFAQELSALPREQWPQAIARRDELVAGFSRRVLAGTRLPFGAMVWFINLRESKDIRFILESLSNEQWNNKVKGRVLMLLRHVQEQGLDIASRDTQLFQVPDALKTKLE